MKIFLFIVIVLFNLGPVLADKINPVSVPIKIFYFSGSGWTEDQIEKKMIEANIIMKQCNLKLRSIGRIVKVETKYTDGSLSLISTSEPEFREDEIQIHSLINAKIDDDFVRIMFVGKVKNLISVLGVSRRKEFHEGEIYENSIYITNQLGTENTDQTIAHEFGHVLLNEGHYNADPSPNILHYQEPQQNRVFNRRQCQKMLKSSLTDRS